MNRTHIGQAIGVIALLLSPYLVTAFVLWESDPGQWGIVGRFVCTAILLIEGVIIAPNQISPSNVND